MALDNPDDVPKGSGKGRNRNGVQGDIGADFKSIEKWEFKEVLNGKFR